MPRILVRLDDVVCFDPEDVTGSGDEFYVVGAVTDGQQSAGVLTTPIQIDSNQTKAFGVGGGVVFDKVVPRERILKIALTAFDEDAAKDWARRGAIVEQIAGAVANGLGAIPNAHAAGAAAVLQFVMPVVDGSFKLDEDDNLGSYTQDIPVWSLSPGDSRREWQFNGSWGGGFLGFSKWSYALRYTVSVV